MSNDVVPWVQCNSSVICPTNVCLIDSKLCQNLQVIFNLITYFGVGLWLDFYVINLFVYRWSGVQPSRQPGETDEVCEWSRNTNGTQHLRSHWWKRKSRSFTKFTISCNYYLVRSSWESMYNKTSQSLLLWNWDGFCRWIIQKLLDRFNRSLAQNWLIYQGVTWVDCRRVISLLQDCTPLYDALLILCCKSQYFSLWQYKLGNISHRVVQWHQ